LKETEIAPIAPIDPLIDPLDRLLRQIEGTPSLLEPDQLRQRAEALDLLDAYFPDLTDGECLAQSNAFAPYERAMKLRASLERVNRELYESIRREIQSGARPAGYASGDDASGERDAEPGPANGMGYDYLDELLSGVLQFDEPAAGSALPEPEMVAYQPTPARHIFRLLALTALTANDVIVDLGSGLGHVPLMVSICTPAHGIGIELEPGYIACARRCAERLNVRNVSFLEQDARAADLSAGTVFYLYTPFRGEILREVLGRLRREAATRPIRVCTYGPCTAVVAEEPWLEAADAPRAERITVFHSRD
jgi:hypothetical protein